MIVGRGERCRGIGMCSMRCMAAVIRTPLRWMRRISAYWSMCGSIRGLMCLIRLAGVFVMGRGRNMMVSRAGILTTATSRALRSSATSSALPLMRI